MEKFVDFIEDIEWKIQCFFMDKFEPETEMQVIFNTIIIQPVKYLVAVIVILAVFSWMISGFGIILILGAIIEKHYFLASMGIIFNLIYFAKFLCLQILRFRQHKKENLLD